MPDDRPRFERDDDPSIAHFNWYNPDLEHHENFQSNSDTKFDNDERDAILHHSQQPPPPPLPSPSPTTFRSLLGTIIHAILSYIVLVVISAVCIVYAGENLSFVTNPSGLERVVRIVCLVGIGLFGWAVVKVLTDEEYWNQVWEEDGWPVVVG